MDILLIYLIGMAISFFLHLVAAGAVFDQVNGRTEFLGMVFATITCTVLWFIAIPMQIGYRLARNVRQ